MPRIFSIEKLGKNRVNGFYQTPVKTVEYMINKILPFWQRGMTILDPAIGNGIFLDALACAGIPKEDIHGFDIDEAKIFALKKEFPNVKLFDSTNPFPQEYDFVIGNPPYNSDESYFVRNNRPRLLKLFRDIGAKNTYSMITHQAIKALKPGGKLCVIISDSFITNIYYKNFRLSLLENTIIEEILLAPWKLFQSSSADVRTCILTITKQVKDITLYSELPIFKYLSSSHNNKIHLIDRLDSEEQYKNPPKVELIEQQEIFKYPNQVFLIGVPKKIRDLFLNPPQRLGNIIEGGTGISTGNDKRFLRKREEVIGNPNWVPYYKNGARRAYWYKPDFYIEKEYQKYAKNIPNYMIRNEKYFFKEGITCSSVGVRFSAAYMPEGGLFGVNTNFFFKDKLRMYYTLGLLNSKIAWYFARQVLIRTNNISANYLRLMPYIEPEDNKEYIAQIVENIVTNLMMDDNYDFHSEQKQLDEYFLEIYKIEKSTREAILEFCNNFYCRL